jgi:PAS domain S-box-containing protein
MSAETSAVNRCCGAKNLTRVRNANAPLDAFVAYAPIAMAMFDLDMRYIAVSERWLTDYQLSSSPVGRRHYDVFPEISEAWKAVHRRCLRGATECSEGDPFLRADGRVEWVKWTACPWRDSDGNVGGIIITTEDITTRKEAEAEAAHYASVVTDSSDAIIAKTLDAVVSSWNAGATRLLGYSAQEMIGQSIARIIPPERLR